MVDWIDETIGEEGRILRDTVREFAREHIPFDRARRMARNHRLDDDLIRAIGDLGIIGVHIPEQYGGSATMHPGYGDRVKAVIVQEELAYRDPSVALFVEGSGGLAGHSILYGGREDQKSLLPKLVTAELVGCYAITEPNSGSDAGAMLSTAEQQGGGWVINGQKNFITNAAYGDLTIWFAITEKGEPRGKHSAFIALQKGYNGRPGYHVKPEDNISVPGSGTSQLTADGLWVPEEAILDGPYPKGGSYKNHGLALALKVLDDGRLVIAADALGMMKRAIDLSVDYAQQRRTFGRPLAEHGPIQQYLGIMKAQYEASRALVYRTAWEADHGDGTMSTMMASAAKNAATESMEEVVGMAVNIYGAYGISREYEMSKLRDDSKVYTIFEGTKEINRMIISRELLRQWQSLPPLD